MGKGIIFSVDAIIAALLATTLLAAVVLSANSAEVESSPVITLRQNAEDALASLDKRGTLSAIFTQSDSATHSSLYSFFNSTLAFSMGANWTVEVYEYESGGSCSAGCQLDGGAPVNSFCACKRLVNATSAACSSSNPCKFVSRGQRMFYDFVSNEDRLGRVTLEVWVKGN